MGFQMRKAASRAALISAMLGGGLLYAGISQAQDAGVQAERNAELAAAAGGPATADHLIPFEADTAAVDVRDDDVAAARPPVEPKVEQAQAVATPLPTPVSLTVAAPARP